jgi:hypothetical protein
VVYSDAGLGCACWGDPGARVREPIRVFATLKDEPWRGLARKHAMIRFKSTAAYACTEAGALGAGLIAAAAGLVYIDWRALASGRDIESNPALIVCVVVALVIGAIGSALFAGACLAVCLRLAVGLSELGSGLRASALARQQAPSPATHSTNK